MCTGLQSIDGLKSLKPLEIVIKNLDIAIRMFDHLKGRVHAANQKPFEVLKYWNELYKSFVIQSCQKIENNALLIFEFSKSVVMIFLLDEK